VLSVISYVWGLRFAQMCSLTVAHCLMLRFLLVSLREMRCSHIIIHMSPSVKWCVRKDGPDFEAGAVDASYE
jgi:hypothetical protein